MLHINPSVETKYRKEPPFELFRHKGLLCCVRRITHIGCINGYVAVTKEHPFFGKSYSDKIKLEQEPKFNGNYIGLLCAAMGEEHKDNLYSLDLAILVHGGLTYAKESLAGIEKDLFGELWWFGFDTSHAGDLSPYQDEISIRFSNYDDEYRDFEYVKEQTQKLAEQLQLLSNPN